MFGHDDNKKNDDANEPKHDDVLGNDAAAADQASPAYIMSSPADTPAKADDSDKAEPVEDKLDAEPITTPDVPKPDEDSLPAVPAAGGDLLDIKLSALKQLTPLVGHLNQTPEEKFRTTMMMIQASDDQSLVKDAYAAAQSISDEKTKAQALLDIINEINYFTQQG